MLALTAAIALNVAFGYGLVSGLATRLIRNFEKPVVVALLKPAPEKELPPPAPHLAAPVLPSVPLPEIRIRNRATVRAPVVVPQQVPTPAPAPQVAPPPPHNPVLVGAHAIVSTHTTPPYPPTTRRLGESGAVTLSIDVMTDGSVANVSVAQSSGSSVLDQTAQDWVRAKWKYRPATRDGVAYESRVLAKVVFDLRNA